MLRGVQNILETIGMVVRVFSVWIIALFLPNLFLWHGNQRMMAETGKRGQFSAGVDIISDRFLTELKSSNSEKLAIGLITNHEHYKKKTYMPLVKKGCVIKKFFVPTDGVVGVNSLGKLYYITDKRRIKPNDFSGIDAIFFDISDWGTPYKQYATILLDALQSAVAADKKLVVLDRPNVLGGVIEGVAQPVPVRHGMTSGELAHYCNTHVLKTPAKLCVVPMKNYNRLLEPRNDKASANTMHVDAWYGKTVLQLLADIEPFDLAQETEQAYQCILLPESIPIAQRTWDALDEKLKALGLQTRSYRYYNTTKKQWYSGLHLFIPELNTVSCYKTALVVLTHFQDAGVSFTVPDSYTLSVDRSTIYSFLQGNVSRASVETMINEGTHCFFKKAFTCFIYKPLPKMVSA